MGRKVFFAGATSFTGRAVLAQPSDLSFVLAVRAGSPRLSRLAGDPRLRTVNFADPDALAAAMTGCDAILCTVGTTRAQFAPGVSYETVDYAIPAALARAGRKAGVAHLVLMSSMGAGLALGPYLAWKARAEQAVRESGVPYTIIRPAFLVGEGRSYPKIVNILTDALARVPGLHGPMRDVRAIPIEVVAWNLVRILSGREDVGKTLSGRDLWAAWERARRGETRPSM